MFKAHMLFKPVFSMCIYGCFFVTSHYHTVFFYPSLPQFRVSFSLSFFLVLIVSSREKRDTKGSFLIFACSSLFCPQTGGHNCFLYSLAKQYTHTRILKYFDLVPMLLLFTEPVRNSLILFSWVEGITTVTKQETVCTPWCVLSVITNSQWAKHLYSSVCEGHETVSAH